MRSKRVILGVAGCAGAGCIAVLAVAAAGGWLAGRAISLPAVVAPSATAPRGAEGAVAWRFAPEISAADRAALIAAGAADVAHVEQRFARRFHAPPPVHVLASEQGLAHAIADLFGVAPARARDLAKRYSGYTGRHIRFGAPVVALDWSRIGVERPIHRLRHELTHVMIQQIVPAPRRLPTWLEEGLAELEAHSVPGLTWTQLQSRHFAASMAATGTLVPLDRLAGYDESFAQLGDQIANATECVRLLEADVTRAAVLRLVDQVAQGKRFDEAFLSATGTPFARFAASTGPRLRALAPSYPGIATAPDEPSGPGLTYVLYGFPPRSRVTVHIRGAGLEGKSTYAVNDFGYLSQFFVRDWPAATYAIEVAGEGSTVRVTAAKRR